MNTDTRTIYLATDHAGFEHKNALHTYLTEAGYSVVDCGAQSYDPEDDYPDYMSVAAARVAEQSGRAVAILLGGSGQGEAMCANRFPDVRAAVYYGGSEDIITLSREHNDANVLSVGARFVSIEELQRVVQLWLQTPFSDEDRHVRRLAKLDPTP